MITSASKPSKIAATVADTLLSMFSGQTVTFDEVGEAFEQQYAMARRRTTYGSYVQVYSAIERAGAKSHGGSTVTDRFFTFPVRAI